MTHLQLTGLRNVHPVSQCLRDVSSHELQKAGRKSSMFSSLVSVSIITRDGARKLEDLTEFD